MFDANVHFKLIRSIWSLKGMRKKYQGWRLSRCGRLFLVSSSKISSWENENMVQWKRLRNFKYKQSALVENEQLSINSCVIAIVLCQTAHCSGPVFAHMEVIPVFWFGLFVCMWSLIRYNSVFYAIWTPAEQSYLNSCNITSLYLDNLNNPALAWGRLVDLVYLEDSVEEK